MLTMNKEEIKRYSVELLRKIADHLEKEEFEEIEKHLGSIPIAGGDDPIHFINFDLGQKIKVGREEFIIKNDIHNIIEKLK